MSAAGEKKLRFFIFFITVFNITVTPGIFLPCKRFLMKYERLFLFNCRLTVRGTN